MNADILVRDFHFELDNLSRKGAIDIGLKCRKRFFADDFGYALAYHLVAIQSKPICITLIDE